jgi:hypothetical protein
MAQEKFEKLRDLAPSVWFLASEDPDKLRIFRKTHALFYYGMGKLLDVYKQSNQLEKAEGTNRFLLLLLSYVQLGNYLNNYMQMELLN